LALVGVKHFAQATTSENAAALLQFRLSEFARDFNRKLKLPSSMSNQPADKLAVLFPGAARREVGWRSRELRQS
jgi:hypothetical protein